jgi:hypothetical protein
MNFSQHQLTAEEKLLISLCRLNFNEEQKSEIRDLMKVIKDWDHFVKLANDHSIIALVAYNIREAGVADQIPEEIITLLDNGRMKSMARNAWLAERWKEVNKILCEAGIRYVLLKGMALEHTVYGSRGLRQMTDNDILVKKEEALDAWNLLQKYGYKPGMIKSYLHIKIITETGYHMPPLQKDGYSIEIHYRLFSEPGKNEKLNDAINNAVEIDINGTKAYILNDRDHLGFLKEHIQKHLISGLSQLMLYLDMELICPGSSPEIPEGFLSNPDQSMDPNRRKEAYRIHYFLLPGRIRLRFLVGDIFPSLRWMKQRHNCGTVKAILFYPQRIGKLFWLLG